VALSCFGFPLSVEWAFGISVVRTLNLRLVVFVESRRYQPELRHRIMFGSALGGKLNQANHSAATTPAADAPLDRSGYRILPNKCFGAAIIPLLEVLTNQRNKKVEKRVVDDAEQVR